ncbi:MAG: ribosome maturation factor RimM [Spirochaetaceae bacterium]|jgi:16S rRNA processing protein RimM|nr:ribosome maturation factor RimM [Spirochaetaceae bacterium]
MIERFVVARAGAPFGLKGWLKITSLSGETTNLRSLKRVFLRDGTEYAIEGVSLSPLSVKLRGVDSPEAAKLLKGAEMLVPRAEAVPLGEGEFYIEDLRGLEVFTLSGAPGTGGPVGHIADVIEGGGGFLVEILFPSGEKKLVPFRNEFFGPVDFLSRRIELLETWILE